MEARLRERFVRIGFHFGDEQFVVAQSLLAHQGFVPDDLTDLQLMTICVEAFRRADVELPLWI